MKRPTCQMRRALVRPKALRNVDTAKSIARPRSEPVFSRNYGASVVVVRAIELDVVGMVVVAVVVDVGVVVVVVVGGTVLVVVGTTSRTGAEAMATGACPAGRAAWWEARWETRREAKRVEW